MSYFEGMWKRKQKKMPWLQILIIKQGIKQRGSDPEKRVGRREEDDCFNLDSFSFRSQTLS